jgi:hypothetical protein
MSTDLRKVHTLVQTLFKGQTVSRQDILSAMADFDKQFADTNDYENWLVRQSYIYVIWHNGRQYPPKHILSAVSGISTAEFSGGDQTNRIFTDLGFEVTRK